MHGQASGSGQPGAFSRSVLNSRLPVVREEQYVVNARVRPLLLFWIGRDNIGGARITWRARAGEGRGFEIVIGSDPARAPRRINRWGFIAEELTAAKGDVLGVMKESGEQTLEEAEANIKRADEDSTFKAVRTKIEGDHAVSGTVAFTAPSKLTYHQL
jgi:hypothetical protein